MESLLSLEFWVFWIIFFIAITVVWLFPGLLLLSTLRIKIEAISQLVLALVTGMALWGLQGYVLGYLNLRALTLVYVFIWAVSALINRGYIWSQFHNSLVSIFSLPKKMLFILVAGIFIQVIQMFGSGLSSNFGMAFFRVHMQDGIYHLSMIQSMVRYFPPMEPGAGGTMVQNYHYWSDLILAELVRVFRIPAHYLFFQYLPPVLSLFTGLAVISVLRLWTKRMLVWFFGLFLLFFGADLGYIVAWALHRVVSFEYPVIDNGATQFLNMPHVMAKLVFVASLVSLWHWVKEIKWKWGALTMLLTAILFGLKIYFGLYAALGLMVMGIFFVVKLSLSRLKHREGLIGIDFVKQLFLCGIIGGILSLTIYLPPNRSSGGLDFYPLEWPKLLLAEANLDWRDWRYKHAVAELEGMTAKIIFYDLEAILITLLTIHGVRILGVFVTRRTGREIGGVWLFYTLVPTFIFTYLGLYTLQVSGGFNVFNFFATSLVPLTLLSAFFFADLWKIKRLGPALVVLLLTLSLPRIFFETQKILLSYRDKSDVLYISMSEISALKSIDKIFPQNCMITSTPNNQVDMNTPYVSYFANRFSFMSGQKVLETHNAPINDRFIDFKNVFADNNVNRIESELRVRHVCALYLKNNDELSKYFENHVKLLFQNSEARVIDLR